MTAGALLYPDSGLNWLAAGCLPAVAARRRAESADVCTRRKLGLLFLLLATTAAGVRAGAEPTLVVVVVVDQLRGDYLEAFGDHFCDGGFKRLMRDGAWFSRAHLGYGVTATGPGHATMLTGVYPSIHGIVGNNWRDSAEKQRETYCCGDDSVRGLGFADGDKAPRRSPRNLRAPTLGDALKAATGGRAKVWSVAIKDRSAILTAGPRADGAIWWDDGAYVSSTYYFPSLPEWVDQLNAARVADRFFHNQWDCLLPEALYGPRFLVATGRSAEVAWRHANGFPKTLGAESETPDDRYYADLLNSPFGNELAFVAARRVIGAEGLGADAVCDLLCVCLASNDIVGHSYGPDSDEVMDCTLRTDRQLADFLAWLDGQVGAGNYLAALTADHGVGPLTEYAMALGMGGGRIDTGAMHKTLNAKLAERFPNAKGTKKLVLDVALPWIYLDEAAMAASRLDSDDVARTAARLAMEYPGIVQAVAVCDLGQSAQTTAPLLEGVRHSVFAGRSGHVYAHWDRYWYRGRKQAGHGSAHDYDQHVPVMLMGPGIRSVKISQPVPATAMVATICSALGIAPPSSQCTAALDIAILKNPDTQAERRQPGGTRDATAQR